MRAHLPAAVGQRVEEHLRDPGVAQLRALDALLEASHVADVPVEQVRQRAHVPHVGYRLAAVLNVLNPAQAAGRRLEQGDLMGTAALVTEILALDPSSMDGTRGQGDDQHRSHGYA